MHVDYLCHEKTTVSFKSVLKMVQIAAYMVQNFHLVEDLKLCFCAVTSGGSYLMG